MGLAALIIPLIPGLVQSVTQIVDAVKSSDQTPEELKAQLDQISADLQAIALKVAAVQLPN
jgi:hypothetical protein